MRPIWRPNSRQVSDSGIHPPRRTARKNLRLVRGTDTNLASRDRSYESMIGLLHDLPRPQQTQSSPLSAEAVPVAVLATIVLGQAVLGGVVGGTSGWGRLQITLVAVAAIATSAAILRGYLQRRAERLRFQANRVYVSTERNLNRDGSLTIVASVYNGSETPIWHVELRPRRDGLTYDDPLTQRVPDVLPATAEQWEWRVAQDDVAREERDPELRFLDANMRCWRRIGPQLDPQATRTQPRHPCP